MSVFVRMRAKGRWLEMKGKVFYHCVLIKFHEGVDEAQQQDIYDRYQTLNRDCGGHEAGILFWAVDRNIDMRKGYHLMELAIFTDSEAFQAFRAHPKHAAIATDLSKLADWVLGDIIAPAANLTTD